MALLLDTHVLLWIGAGDARLSRPALSAIEAPDAELFVSSVTAYEYEDLRLRGRLGDPDPIGAVVDQLDAFVLPYPAEAHPLVALMPQLHRDPVDRMLIAHALHADMTIVTAARTIPRYPVRTLW